jgi:hypothetical protein
MRATIVFTSELFDDLMIAEMEPILTIDGVDVHTCFKEEHKCKLYKHSHHAKETRELKFDVFIQRKERPDGE